MLQQPALDLEQVAAARMREAAQALGCDHAVAGNHQRKIIAAAGLAHRARRGAQGARQVAIGPGFTQRNRRYLFPYAALEGGADLLQRQLEAVAGIADIFFDLFAGPLGQRVGQIGRASCRERV